MGVDIPGRFGYLPRKGLEAGREKMAQARFGLGGMAFDFVRKGGIGGFPLNTPGIPNIEFVKR